MKYILLLLSLPSFLFGAAHADLETPDLNQVDWLTKKPFQEIIKTNSEAGLGTLVARVQTKVGANVYDAVYDAFALNKRLFDNDQPNISMPNLFDPQTKRPITDLRYFFVRSPEDHEPSTVGSIAGMKISAERTKFVESLFRANNPNTPAEQRIPVFIEIGNRYATGKGLRASDAQQARYWYTKALNQQVDKRSLAKANYHLGLLYKKGSSGIAKDLPLARMFFEKAVNQNVSVGSKEYGRYHLAGADRAEGDIFKAWAVYRDLAQNATMPEVKRNAQEALEKIQKEVESLEEPSQDYGLKDKGVDPAAYESSTLYQLQSGGHEKLSAFKQFGLNGSESPELPEHELSDQNTPPHNDSLSSSE